MYTYMGRTVFLLLYVAFSHVSPSSTVAMVFGGTRTDSDSLCVLNIIVGTIGIIICLFDFFVVCNHPAFKKGGEFYNAGVEEGEEGAPQKKPTEMKQKETKRAAVGSLEREKGVLMSRSRRTRAIRSSPRMTTTSRPPVCPVPRSRPRAPRSRPRKPKSRKTIRLRMIILLTINCCVMFRDVCFNLVLECPSIGEMRDIGG